MIAIVGGGAVGLRLASSLALAGEAPLLVVRRAAQQRALEREGLEQWDPATDERQRSRVACRVGVAALAAEPSLSIAVVATRVRETAEVADALARACPGAAVASAQNDVCSDGLLAERFAAVAGIVVRQTCSRRGDDGVTATGRGRLVVGAVTAAGEPARDHLLEAFGRTAFDVGRSDDLAADRWLKLCVNLMSVPNALVRRADHRSADFTEAKACLLEEARAALAAASIRAASGDGGDRDLDAEIEAQRAALRDGTSARDLPLYNAVWSALAHGGDPEADAYHRRIVELARGHGLSAPWNERALALLEQAVALGRGPEQLRAAELRPRAALSAPP